MTALEAGGVGPPLESRTDAGGRPRPVRRRSTPRTLLGVAMNIVMFFVLLGVAAATAVLGILYMIAVGTID